MLELIQKILPPLYSEHENYIVIRNIVRNDQKIQPQYSAHLSLEKVEQIALDFDKRNKDELHYKVFLSVATHRDNIVHYSNGTSRAEFKAGTANRFKSLFCDIPINKATYGNIVEAVKNIAYAMECIGIKHYILIDCGHQIQLIVLLNDALSGTEWLKLAIQWKNALKATDLLIVEESITNLQFLIYLPGIYNRYNDLPGYKVEIVQNSSYHYSIDEVKDYLSVYNIEPQDSNVIDIDGALFNEYASTLKEIGNYNNLKTKCQQLKFLSEKDDIPIEMVNSVLGITSFCENPYEVSQSILPNIDKNKLKLKLQQFISLKNNGPTQCITLDRYNPGTCDNCEYKNKISTPLKLALGEEHLKDIDPLDDLPRLPKGYLHRNNRLYRILTTGEELKIFDYMGYLEDMGMELHAVNPITYFQFRFKVPHHGWIPLRFEAHMLYTKGGKDSVIEKCTNAGIFMQENEIRLVKDYMIACARERQASGKQPAKIISQFGWDDDGKHFNWGKKSIGALLDNAVIPKDDSIAAFANAYRSKGSLSDWVKITDLLAYDSMKFHAFALFLGFGAPLTKFANLSGASVNLYSELSGTGKSTMGFLLNSIYGNPKELTLTAMDTDTALFIKMGIINNLPVYIDEVSHDHWDGARISNFLYFASGGKQKATATQTGNLKDTRSWNTIVVTSSNISFLDRLQAHTKSSDGQEARFLEIPFVENEHTQEFGRQVGVNVMSSIYGVAGEIYLKELMKMKEAGKLLNDISNARPLYEKTFNFGFLSEERFIANTICCAWVGAIFAQKLGLVSNKIDLAFVFGSINHLILRKRSKKLEDKTTPLEVINQFIAEHQHKMVKVTRYDNHDSKGYCPDDAILGRIELHLKDIKSESPYKGTLFITQDAFKTYCREKRHPFNAIIDGMKNDSLNFGVSNITLTSGIDKTVKGADAAPFNVKCLHIELPNSWLDSYTLKPGR